MLMSTRPCLFLVLAALAAPPALAQDGPTPPETPRIYIFDNGAIRGLNPELFNFSADELAEPDLVNISYLIAHPNGTLMFDAGAVPDSEFEGHEGPVVEGTMSATQPLRPQLEAAGYSPDDVTYFALSHYHSDHTANANDFAGATWIVQEAERDFMFADDPDAIINTESFGELGDAETVILDNEDFDVFGDGSVIVMATPGHTPGHQVVAVTLANSGTIVLGGDLYHYPEEITTGRVPTFEFDAEQTHASRAKIQAFLEMTGGTLWIEHDIATHAQLPRSPEYVD
ncbi:N-acyl homoserine lactonase family protein [Candidatus Rariloculus sp.]|uniref:N-acyl homoserine lactonase family protein n=1 Tax=Candidatus Rariloculus sp. TaxID=3101265 RepID=UPI003D0D675E